MVLLSADGGLRHTMTGNTAYARDIAVVGTSGLISADTLAQVHIGHAPLGPLPCTLHFTLHNPARCLPVSPAGHHLAIRLDSGQVGLLDISRW